MPDRKRIFINASTVKIGGGLIVAQNIIAALSINQSYDLLITSPHEQLYNISFSKSAILKVVPDWMLYKPLRIIHDFFWLPYQIRMFQPDVVLTLSNLPSITICNQIYLHDNPYVIENVSSRMQLSYFKFLTHQLRRYLTLRRIKFVDLIIVQTEYQKIMLSALLNIETPVKILAPGIPYHLTIKSSIEFEYNFSKKYIKVACLSRYYEHKNIEILYKAAENCNLRNLPIQFILTLEKEHSIKSKRLIKKIMQNNQNNRIINIGSIENGKIVSFMKAIDALILPSFFETFGLNCIDAWFFGKPFFVNNTESIKSTCGEAAVYFNSDSDINITNTIVTVFNNKDKMKKLIEHGREKLIKLPSWEEYNNIIEEFST